MSRKKISSTIYITPEQSERLKLLHERTKVPISVYIREGIDLVLKQYESVLPGQMSLVSNPDLSPLPPPSIPPPADKKSGLGPRPYVGRSPRRWLAAERLVKSEWLRRGRDAGT